MQTSVLPIFYQRSSFTQGCRDSWRQCQTPQGEGWVHAGQIATLLQHRDANKRLNFLKRKEKINAREPTYMRGVFILRDARPASGRTRRHLG